mmetsp:Transcript_116631/g.267714  ORF Transcript_116631/g.267714 Transcript_116631/m.267714 type:complete len:307 (-) Transcript_116631:93-1013(-)
MVIPIPPGLIPDQGGRVPTDYALRMRNVIIFILILQVAVIVGRFMMMDIWGAIVMILTVLIGYWLVSSAMDITVNFSYGTMNAVNCFFDSIHLLIYVAKLNKPLFADDAGFAHNFVSAMMVLAPITGLIAAMVCYRIDKDFRENQSETFPMAYAGGGGGQGGGQQMDFFGTPMDDRPPQQGQRQSLFAGQGYRLGDGDNPTAPPAPPPGAPTVAPGAVQPRANQVPTVAEGSLPPAPGGDRPIPPAAPPPGGYRPAPAATWDPEAGQVLGAGTGPAPQDDPDITWAPAGAVGPPPEEQADTGAVAA